MPDIVDQATRSRMMAGIRSKDTQPEMRVRRWLHARGYRYRLHPAGLPGHPDLILPRYRTVVFVNGCFWHRHEDCRFAYEPKTRASFWQAKFRANLERDARVSRDLSSLGWNVEIVWECETRGNRLEERLGRLEVALRASPVQTYSDART